MEAERTRGPELGRRTLVLVVLAVVVGVPALVLRVTCTGGSCGRPRADAGGMPYCSLPGAVRSLIAAGFRDGRSPDVAAVTTRGKIAGDGVSAWPAVDGPTFARAPVVFSGTGATRGAPWSSPGLDDIAPTIADIIGLARPHPEVRSGDALPGIASGARPRLVLLVAWKGAGVAPGPTPVLDRLARRGTSVAAATGALPLDAAAAAATIGTGALPRQHGITGRLVRNDAGRVVRAWSRGAPVPVVATLGDDLDREHRGAARIGLISDDRADRGLIGGRWYPGADDDDVRVVTGRDHLWHVRRLLDSGYGRDRVPDLLAVARSGRARELDAHLGDIVVAARRAAHGSVLVVVAGTGGPSGAPDVTHREVGEHVSSSLGPVVERAAAAGLFLDQDALAAAGVGDARVAETLMDMHGGTLFADAFPATSIAFGRYC